MTLTGATVFIGIATSILTVGSLVTALFAFLAYRKQSQEVRAIQKQVEDQEDAQLRSQAVEVTAWLERPEHNGPWKAHIHNASDQCIFDVRTFFYEISKKPGEGWEPVLIGGSPPRDETICVFPPDSRQNVDVPERVLRLLQNLNERTCVVGIEFTDAAEQDWKRDPHGALVRRTDTATPKLGHPLARLQPDRR